MLPCLTNEGKLMLDLPGELAMAPNGNGGVYMSLRDEGILSMLQKEGVQSIFQFGVDNILCHVADPTFLGFCASKGADCASKTVPKAHAHEPVGVIALAGGKPAVVEYSEISNEMAEATDKKGNLLFGASHICVNYFSLSFLRHFCEERLTTLPLHVAKKKIPYTRSPDGKRIHPTSPNGIKLELFIFDTFPHAKRMAALMVPREDEFAPVKNAKGSDSPDTARDLIYSLSSRRLKAAGATIKPKVNQTAEMANELIHQFENLGKGVESLIMRSGMTTPPPGSAAAPASTTTAENGGGTMPAMTAAAAAAQRETMQAMAACLPGGGNGKGPLPITPAQNGHANGHGLEVDKAVAACLPGGGNGNGVVPAPPPTTAPAGAKVAVKEDVVEVSPLLSYEGEGLEEYKDKALTAPVCLEAK